MSEKLSIQEAQAILDKNCDIPIKLVADLTDRTEFFIGELAKIDGENERRYLSLARRVNELEEKNRGALNDDPARLMGGVFIVLIGLQLLPVILDMVKQWRSSSLSSSSV